MRAIEKLQQVATETEIYTVNIAIRTVIDEYNNLTRDKLKSITFMEVDEVKLINSLSRRTWDVFGGNGMLLPDQILTACGFVDSHN